MGRTRLPLPCLVSRCSSPSPYLEENKHAPFKSLERCGGSAEESGRREVTLTILVPMTGILTCPIYFNLFINHVRSSGSWLLIQNSQNTPGPVVHVANPSNREGGSGGLVLAESQSGLLSEALSQRKNQKEWGDALILNVLSLQALGLNFHPRIHVFFFF